MGWARIPPDTRLSRVPAAKRADASATWFRIASRESGTVDGYAAAKSASDCSGNSRTTCTRSGRSAMTAGSVSGAKLAIVPRNVDSYQRYAEARL